MYGIVNVAIKEFAVENFGEEKWEIILEESGVDVDFTVTDNPFNDGIVYKLAQAAAEEMNAARPLSENKFKVEMGKQTITNALEMALKG